MILKIYALFDSKIGVFLRPFFAQSKGQVLRDLSDVVNRGSEDKSPIAKHPGDFSLFELGTFDDASAEIVSHIAPERVLILHELVKE